jgi:CheY-like chemotaxis protein
MILLDLTLPKVDGLQVLQVCKGHPFTRNIPVLVLTSSDEQREQIDNLQLPVERYFDKPSMLTSCRTP